MRPGAVRSAAAGGVVTALACAVAVLAGASPAVAQTRQAQARPIHTRPSQHVAVVGLSGPRWSDVSQAAAPVLGQFAARGSVGSAAALPLALALGAGVLAAAATNRYRPFQGSNQEGDRAVSAIAATRRPVPAHDLAADGDGRGKHPGLGRGHPGR